MNKNGFTLVELLATVVILGVLITIASFSATAMINNAKKKAGSLAVSNLKEAAITYYKQNKDISKLADLLGHSSINTTRIYMRESGAVHARQIAALGLVRDTT